MEKIQNEPLSDYQNKWFKTVEEQIRNGYEISIPTRAGNMMSILMIYAINDWKDNYMLEVVE